jgi:hypothetical protein
VTKASSIQSSRVSWEINDLQRTPIPPITMHPKQTTNHLKNIIHPCKCPRQRFTSFMPPSRH